MTAKKTCSARGRPRCFDVDRAVEIAMTLFHERGYDGVGVAELAKAIGVNPPSLYAAFGSKYGLFERAVERYAKGNGGFIAEVLGQSQNPKEAIQQVFHDAAKAFTDDLTCPGCLVMDGTRNCIDPEARALTNARREETRKMIADWMGGHGLCDAEALTDTLMIGLAGLSAAARDGMSREVLSQAADRLAMGLIANLDVAVRPEH